MSNTAKSFSHIENSDQQIYDILVRELNREHNTLELIASENFVSYPVLEMAGGIMTNKYAEGYPGARYYGGCQYVDEAENLARDRAKELFECEYANVQPHSGSQANAAAYLAMMKPGDRLLGMSLSHGGHLTHGSPVNVSGKWFKAVHYGVDPDTETLNMEKIRENSN